MKNKLRTVNLGRKHTVEARANMSKGQIGNSNGEKSFTLVSPDGTLVSGTNLRQFALANNLNPGHLNNVYRGKRKSHKGWSRIEQA